MLNILERITAHWPGRKEELRRAEELDAVLQLDPSERPTDLPPDVMELVAVHDYLVRVSSRRPSQDPAVREALRERLFGPRSANEVTDDDLPAEARGAA